MPRLADHRERRRTITDAVRRVVARLGLEAATFQAVAAEAGVSVRLLQYYFGTKDELLRATHRAVIETAAERFGRMPSEPASDTALAPRHILRRVIEMLLPLDDERRDDAVVLAAFHAAAITGPDGGPDYLLGAPRVLADVVAAQLARSRGGDSPGAGSGTGHDRGLVLDAELVVASVAGLTQGMLSGFYGDEEAQELVERLLDRFMGPPGAPVSPEP